MQIPATRRAYIAENLHMPNRGPSSERVTLTCAYCAAEFDRPRFQHEANLRRGRPGPYCSKSCANRATPRTPSTGVQLDRLIDRTRLEGDCWVWTGARNTHGYGHIRRQGKSLGITRLVVELTTGKPIPNGLFVLHSCDNPPCVRPAHLRVGSAAENATDRKVRGRGRWDRSA